MKKILLFAFLNTCLCAKSQLLFDYQDSIQVARGSKLLKFPWAGGLNYVQFSDLDYDFDGDLDLFIFDRSQDNIRLFENKLEGTIRNYYSVYNPAKLFPTDLEYRVALLDYDQDGKMDIFTHAFSGIKVYHNIGNAQIGLQWKVVEDLAYSTNNMGQRNHLYVSSSDVPAYTDVDSDGDIDILTYNIGGDRVEYHQNQSQEKYGHNDSLIFELKNECWGKFKEDLLSSNIFLNDQTSPCVGSVIVNPQLKPLEDIGSDKSLNQQHLNRHTGSTLLALDIDQSGVLDLLVGDVNSTHLSMLINGGTTVNSNSAMISKDTLFPSYDVPIDLTLFPAGYYLDVDNDNKKDLLVGANARNASENTKGILFYKNNGTNTLPQFKFQTRAFLQEEMIDVGTGSIPVMVDENGDGQKDLLLANFFSYFDPLTKKSLIANYRNSSTIGQSKFNWVADDYFNLSGQNLGLRTVPTFGDLDGDLDQDMFLGLENGTLLYLENTSGFGNSFSFGSLISNYSDVDGNIITATAYNFPQLFDLDKDGLLDLLIGTKNGEIKYYQNVGTSSNAAYKLIDDTLGEIDISLDNTTGYAAPHFFRYQDTTRLLVGGYDGKLILFDNIDGNIAISDSFRMVTNQFRQIDVEAYSSCWVEDFDQDGKLDLFVGGDLGGLYHFEHNENSVLGIKKNEIKEEITIYPNPSKGIYQIKASNLKQYELSVYTTYGQEIISNKSATELIDLSNFSDGIYLLRITNLQTNQILNSRLIKCP